MNKKFLFIFKKLIFFLKEIEDAVKLYQEWKTPTNEKEFSGVIAHLESDLEYLIKMEEMDDEIMRNRIERGEDTKHFGIFLSPIYFQ